jgi:hypothetical protein
MSPYLHDKEFMNQTKKYIQESSKKIEALQGAKKPYFCVFLVKIFQKSSIDFFIYQIFPPASLRGRYVPAWCHKTDV